MLQGQIYSFFGFSKKNIKYLCLKKKVQMKQIAITAAVVIVALAIYGKFLKSKIEG